jgi:carboxyvinyl-carboxyphosphonate phosphorylmutase
MLSPADRRRAFRKILQGNTCLTPASVSDPLSMRAAQDLGFEVALLAGSVASLVVLGAPDIALLTSTELAEQVRRICRAGDLPLLVDGDHGYGNALNVRRTIEDVEAAGAAAITIEDTVLPASFGSAAADQRVSLPELAGKIRAALDARTDENFTIVGRTSAALSSNPAGVLTRQAALQDAGADAVFVLGVKALQDLDPLAKAARVPLIVGSVPPEVTAGQLSERNVRLCLAGHRAYFDAVAATYERLHQQRVGSTAPAARNGIEPQTLVKQLSLAERYARWAQKFLS